jgi:hypothetical protein
MLAQHVHQARNVENERKKE